MFRIVLLCCLLGWSVPARAQDTAVPLPSRWIVHAGWGYQWAPAAPVKGRFTDILFSYPESGLVSAFDLSCFIKPAWGVFVGGRLSRSQRDDWPGNLQRALERDYPGRLIRLTHSRGTWNGSVTQLMAGIRGNFVWKHLSLKPSFAAGFTESFVSGGGADLKTPDTHELVNVFAFTYETDPWAISWTLDAGVRLDIPVWKRIHFSLSAHYTWVKPDIEFDFHTVDQITENQTHEHVSYKNGQNLFILTGGLSYYFKRRWQ